MLWLLNEFLEATLNFSGGECVCVWVCVWGGDILGRTALGMFGRLVGHVVSECDEPPCRLTHAPWCGLSSSLLLFPGWTSL